jgi:hypothetical protein
VPETAQSPQARYLVPRQIVTRTEIMSGVGPMEALLIAAGLAVGIAVQFLLALIGHLVPAHAVAVRHALLIGRFLIVVLCAGAGYMATRPVAGGSVLDYARALRAWSARPHVYLYAQGGDDA